MSSAPRYEPDFLIWGAYGGHNFGDEAILRAVSQQLRRVRPGARQFVIILGKLSPAIAEEYRAAGLEPVPFFSFGCLKLLGSAQLIAGGGQLLDDSSLGWPAGYTSVLLTLNRMFRNRPVLLCIGANPVRRALVRAMVRFAYSLAAKCTCRDEDSAAVLLSCGVPDAKVRVTRDVVFSLAPHQLPRLATSPDRKQVAIAVCHDPKRKRGDASIIASLARSLANAGFRVELTGHDLRPAYDRHLLEILQAELHDIAAISFTFPDSLESLLQFYASCDVVISNRMHPLILASLIGCLPVAVAETPKVRALVANLGMPVVDTASAAQISSQVLALLQNRTAQDALIARKLVEFRAKVENTVDELFTAATAPPPLDRGHSPADERR